MRTVVNKLLQILGVKVVSVYSYIEPTTDFSSFFNIAFGMLSKVNHIYME